MDELPPNARAALAQLKHVHDLDDPEAKARVHARVVAAVGIGAGAAGLAFKGKALASAGHKTLWARLAAHKLSTALGVAGVTSVGVVGAGKVPELLARHTEVAAPAAKAPRTALGQSREPVRAPATDALPPAAQEPLAAAAQPAATEPAQREAPAAAADTLPAELALLAEADRALAAGRPAEALAIVTRHAARFPEAALGEEQRGLEAIARCQLGEPAAREGARAFMEAYPEALLTRRIALACAR